MNMHTTALCSPTRSCILTGRNHHSNAMSCITEGSNFRRETEGTGGVGHPGGDRRDLVFEWQRRFDQANRELPILAYEHTGERCDFHVMLYRPPASLPADSRVNSGNGLSGRK